MGKATFKGVGTAIVTPFKQDKSIDWSALEKFIEHQIAGGVDFLVVQGTTGESPTLSDVEKQELLEKIAAINNKRLPIVYGIGGNNTVEVAEKIKKANVNLIDGILSVSPYYNKPTQQGIFEHYKHLSEASDLPIIVYNVPGRTSSNILPETTLRLAELKNIAAVKEASGNMDQIMEIIRCRPKGFLVLSGDDPITLPLIAAGADGVISVVSNALPELFCAMVHEALAGNFVSSREKHYQLLEITRMFFAEGNPAGVKESMHYRKLIEPHLRLPLVNVSEKLRTSIHVESKRILSL